VRGTLSTAGITGCLTGRCGGKAVIFRPWLKKGTVFGGRQKGGRKGARNNQRGNNNN